VDSTGKDLRSLKKQTATGEVRTNIDTGSVTLHVCPRMDPPHTRPCASRPAAQYLATCTFLKQEKKNSHLTQSHGPASCRTPPVHPLLGLAPRTVAPDLPRAACTPRLAPHAAHPAHASCHPRLTPQLLPRTMRCPRLALRSPASRQLASIGQQQK
jgi:hypothetical protein